MTDANASRQPTPIVSPSGVLEEDLAKAMLVLLRILRAGRRLGGGKAEPLGAELHAWLAAVADRHGEVSLRVAVDGLYLGVRRLVECTPRDDPAFFRLFQHGVRQVSFQPGLSRDELLDLLEVLTADLASVENVEEDLATLLADKDFASIQFVIVETFAERDDAEDGPPGAAGRGGDVAGVLAAAIRRTLADDPDLASSKSSGGTIKMWSADVKFFESADLPALMRTLPEGGAARVDVPIADGEIAGFGADLRRSLELCTPWLPRACFAMLRGASAADADPILQILGSQLLSEATTAGLGRVGEPLRAVAAAVERHAGTPFGSALAGAVFSPALRLAAMRAIERDPSALDAAVRVLCSIPGSEHGKTLTELVRQRRGPARSMLLTAVVNGARGALEAAAALIPEADGEAALAMLRGASSLPVRGAAAELHQAALRHEDAVVRATALYGLGQEEAGRALVTQGLADQDRRVRATALYLLATAHAGVAWATIRRWLESPEPKEVDLDERRTAALLLAKIGGKDVADSMREIARRSNVTLSRRAEEVRAAAIASLGMLGDHQSRPLVAKLVKGLMVSPVLREEAQVVLAALDAGRKPYPDPIAGLEATLAEMGLGPALPGAPLPQAPVPGDAPVREELPSAAADRGAPEPTQLTQVQPVLSPGPGAEDGKGGPPLAARSQGAPAPPLGGRPADAEGQLAASGGVALPDILAGYSFDDLRNRDEE